MGKADDLRKELCWELKPAWDRMSEAERGEALQLAEEYRRFLDEAKTERKAAREVLRLAGEGGFGRDPDRPLWVHRGKVVALALLGERPPEEGLRIVVSHLDAPRLDLKQNPLYEEVGLALLKTQYYGGIKKYQWVTRPLAIHGVVVRRDGSSLEVCIGEDEDEPVFTVLDLLPHLARKVQYERKLNEAIPGEKLNVLVGSLPLEGEEAKERVKLEVLRLLRERYGLVEEDFVSSELEVVPAGRARDVGFDRSLIGGYGQDDRICAYASLRAILDLGKRPPHACLCLFVDKEEIGSEGDTSARSRFLEVVVAELLRRWGRAPEGDSVVRALLASRALSADVNGALDPDYQEVHEKRNAARLGYGVCLTKFTGHGGKYSASDAHAEYLGWLRGVFKREGVVWQSGQLGKVDEGGGGTVAKFLAAHGMEIVDCGTPLLSMHSPFEIASKADLYMTFKAYRAFLRAE